MSDPVAPSAIPVGVVKPVIAASGEKMEEESTSPPISTAPESQSQANQGKEEPSLNETIIAIINAQVAAALQETISNLQKRQVTLPVPEASKPPEPAIPLPPPPPPPAPPLTLETNIDSTTDKSNTTSATKPNGEIQPEKSLLMDQLNKALVNRQLKKESAPSDSATDPATTDTPAENLKKNIPQPVFLQELKEGKTLRKTEPKNAKTSNTENENQPVLHEWQKVQLKKRRTVEVEKGNDQENSDEQGFKISIETEKTTIEDKILKSKVKPLSPCETNIPKETDKATVVSPPKLRAKPKTIPKKDDNCGMQSDLKKWLERRQSRICEVPDELKPEIQIPPNSPPPKKVVANDFPSQRPIILPKPDADIEKTNPESDLQEKVVKRCPAPPIPTKPKKKKAIITECLESPVSETLPATNNIPLPPPPPPLPPAATMKAEVSTVYQSSTSVESDGETTTVKSVVESKTSTSISTKGDRSAFLEEIENFSSSNLKKASEENTKRNAFLEEIESFSLRSLKKVLNQEDPSPPRPTSQQNDQARLLMEGLAAALRQREKALHSDDEDDENEDHYVSAEDDEWDD